MHRVLRQLLTIARYAWAGPCTLVGLVLVVPILLRRGTVRVRSGVLEAAPPESSREAQHRFIAITFGHVVLGRSVRVLDDAWAHELEHVRQYERWGLFFFPAYAIASLVGLVRGRSPYWHNHFEVQARERSGGGAD